MGINNNSCINLRCGPRYGRCDGCWIKAIYAVANADTPQELERVDEFYRLANEAGPDRRSRISHTFLVVYQRAMARIYFTMNHNMDERLLTKYGESL